VGNEKPRTLQAVEQAIWRLIMKIATGSQASMEVNDFLKEYAHITKDSTIPPTDYRWFCNILPPETQTTATIGPGTVDQVPQPANQAGPSSAGATPLPPHQPKSLRSPFQQQVSLSPEDVHELSDAREVPFPNTQESESPGNEDVTPRSVRLSNLISELAETVREGFNACIMVSDPESPNTQDSTVPLFLRHSSSSDARSQSRSTVTPLPEEQGRREIRSSLFSEETNDREDSMAAVSDLPLILSYASQSPASPNNEMRETTMSQSRTQGTRRIRKIMSLLETNRLHQAKNIPTMKRMILMHRDVQDDNQRLLNDNHLLQVPNLNDNDLPGAHDLPPFPIRPHSDLHQLHDIPPLRMRHPLPPRIAVDALKSRPRALKPLESLLSLTFRRNCPYRWNGSERPGRLLRQKCL
jgi:hypothetical protein